MNIGLLSKSDFISIQKRLYLNRAEVSASVESKQIGLVTLIKRGSDWEVERIYSDRTYDRMGRLTNRLYNSLPILNKDIEVIENRLSDNLIDILEYMEKDWQNKLFMLIYKEREKSIMLNNKKETE